MKLIFSSLLMATASLIGQNLSASELLPPGAGPVTLLGSTAAAEGDLAGTVLLDKLTPFTISSASGALLFKAVLQNRVVKSTSGALHFYYRIRDTQGGLNGIVRGITTTSFSASPLMSAGWRPDGLGTVNPGTALRSSGSGTTVRFEFNSAGQIMVGGLESKFFYLKTNRVARYDERGTTRIQLKTGEAISVPTAQPLR